MLASLRSLLLALAMVLQTIAGGAGVAHASPSAVGASGHEHCVQMPDGASASADMAQSGRPAKSQGQSCQHCLLCGGHFGATIAPLVISVSAVAAIRVEYSLAPTPPLVALVLQSPPARGPPA